MGVVELAAGTDPAELVQQGGAEAIATAVEAGGAVRAFRVERALKAATIRVLRAVTA